MTDEQRERKKAYLREWYVKNRERRIAKAAAWQRDEALLRQALEEAARVCEDLDEEALCKEGRLASGRECAAAIRAMKEQP